MYSHLLLEELAGLTIPADIRVQRWTADRVDVLGQAGDGFLQGIVLRKDENYPWVVIRLIWTLTMGDEDVTIEVTSSDVRILIGPMRTPDRMTLDWDRLPLDIHDGLGRLIGEISDRVDRVIYPV